MPSTPEPAGLPADLRYAIQFSPRLYRNRLTALGVLCQEITGVVRECSDAGVADVKLRWWEEEIGLILDGKARHPAAQAFHAECAALRLARRPFIEFVDGVRQDIHAPGFATFQDVELYCSRRGAAFAELTARLCDAESGAIFELARRMGSIRQLANIVSQSGADAQFGRVYFAAEDLRKHKLDQHVRAGIHSDAGLKALLADYTERAREWARNTAVPAATAAQSLITARILARLALARLDRLDRRNFVTGAEPVELSPLGMLLTAWSAARHPSLI
jgi:phytoene synthase